MRPSAAGLIILAATALPLERSEAQTVTAGQIANFGNQGNLDPKYDLPCIDLKDASAWYNPPDLFKAARACVVARRFDDAARLDALAKAFGRFDTLRVADSSAHQALAEARTDILGELAPADRNALVQAAARLTADPRAHEAWCARVRDLGGPRYSPTYMVARGIKPVAGSKDGLVADFKDEESWKALLDGDLGCKTA